MTTMQNPSLTGATTGRPILFVARNSSAGSSAGRQAVAAELAAVVNRTADEDGFDANHLLPTSTQIVADLKDRSERTRSTRAGKPDIVNDFYLYDFGTVLMLVSTGSGKAVGDDLNQPFVDHLAHLLRERRPWALVVNRNDRISRAGAASTGPILVALHELDIFLRDEVSLRQVDEMDQLMNGVRAYSANQEAKAIHKKTRQGIVRATGTIWNVKGIPYAATDPPPGMCRVRVSPETGGKATTQLFLDDPNHHPRPDQVGSNALVNKPAGMPSNLACVRWALANLGKAGMTLSTVGAQLCEWQFSTPGLRRHHGNTFTFADIDDDSAPQRAMRAIIARLDFYRTGELPINTGHDEVANVTITNVFPPEGAWAQPDDFDRIDAYLASTRGGGPAIMPLVGVEVDTANGRGVLRKDCSSGYAHHYLIANAATGKTLGAGFTTLPHRILANSIAEALINAADTVLIPADDRTPTHLAELDRQLAQADRNLAEHHAKANALLDQLDPTVNEGATTLSATTRTALSERHTTYVEEHVEPARTHLQDLRTQRDTAHQQWIRTHVGAPDNLLLHLVASLADPDDAEHNTTFKQAVRITDMATEKYTYFSHKGQRMIWTGEIRLTGAGQTFTIKFNGTYEYGAAAHVDAKTDQAIAWMLEGIPLPDMQGRNRPHRLTQWESTRKAIAARLGFISGRFALGSCPHPRLTRIGIRLALNEGDINAVATELGEPVHLVEAVNAIMKSGRPDWAGLITLLGIT